MILPHGKPAPMLSSGRDVTVSRAVGTALWVASRRGIAVTRL